MKWIARSFLGCAFIAGCAGSLLLMPDRLAAEEEENK